MSAGYPAGHMPYVNIGDFQNNYPLKKVRFQVRFEIQIRAKQGGSRDRNRGSQVGSAFIDQVQIPGFKNGLGPAFHIHFRKNIVDMPFDSTGRDEKLISNVFI